MEKNNNLTNESRNSFLKLFKAKDIDEITFDDWKSELEKELPIFWEEMNRK
jgi:hypothetical protein